MSPDLEESGEWAFRGSLQEENAEAAGGPESIISEYAAASGSFRGVQCSGGGRPTGQAPGGGRCSGISVWGVPIIPGSPVPPGCGLVPSRWRVPGGLGDSPEAAKPGRVGPRRELEAANVPRRRLSRQ